MQILGAQYLLPGPIYGLSQHDYVFTLQTCASRGKILTCVPHIDIKFEYKAA